MQGSVAITPNPFIMENTMFREKLGLSLTRSVLQGSNKTSEGNSISRCLFGPPDVKKSSDLVRDVELKNALKFGKRFNFDIVNGEPFPSAKRMKLSPPCDDSDEENVVQVHATIVTKEDNENEGYDWSEKYSQDYMAMCNKHSVSTSIVGPSRKATVSLLFAPIINYSNHTFSPSSSPKSTTSGAKTTQESPKYCSESESSPSSIPSATILIPCPLTEVASSETNNNNIAPNNNKSHSISVAEKRHNRINSNHLHNSHPNHLTSAKKPTLATAHHILTKYANRVVKHAVMKKPRKAIITDYLHVRRMKANNQIGGKKQ